MFRFDFFDWIYDSLELVHKIASLAFTVHWFPTAAWRIWQESDESKDILNFSLVIKRNTKDFWKISEDQENICQGKWQSDQVRWELGRKIQIIMICVGKNVWIVWLSFFSGCFLIFLSLYFKCQKELQRCWCPARSGITSIFPWRVEACPPNQSDLLLWQSSPIMCRCKLGSPQLAASCSWKSFAWAYWTSIWFSWHTHRSFFEQAFRR